MKILQINIVGQNASTGRTCWEMQQYINENSEHECRTAFALGVEYPKSTRIGNVWEWKMHALLSRITGKQACFSWWGTYKLLRYMDDYAPDVVVLRNLHGNYIHLPMLLKYLAKNDIATVAVLHDCWFFTGKCVHYTMTNCNRWTDGCYDCPRLKTDNPSWFFDRTKSLWYEKKVLFESIPRLAVIGVSEWITNEARKSFLSCAKEIRRIYNWINLETFAPKNNNIELRAKYGLTGKKIVLGVASGWSVAKGLDIFCKIAEKLDDNYRIVLVGSMPDRMCLPKSVLNIPPTESVSDLAEVYSMADVFVTTSPEESFGKVSAEALACGTPVVCFDSTANKELVGHGCGVVVKLGDISGMIEAIIKVCSADNEKNAACRLYAQNNFDKRKCIEEYIALFELGLKRDY